MKTVTGKVVSRRSIGVEEICSYLSEFSKKDNGASQAVSAYLRRATAAFNELRRVHTKPRSKLVANGDNQSDTLVAEAKGGIRSAISEKKKGKIKKEFGSLENESIVLNEDSYAKVKSKLKEENGIRVENGSATSRSKIPLKKEPASGGESDRVEKEKTKTEKRVGGIIGLESENVSKYEEKLLKRKKLEVDEDSLSGSENLKQSKKKIRCNESCQ